MEQGLHQDFGHNGFGSVLDLDLREVREYRARLNDLEAETHFRVSQYWNRRWEYPFFMHVHAKHRPVRILDAGAGKSLLPLWLSLQGCDVTALDIDDGTFYPVGTLSSWYAEMARRTSSSPRFVQGDILRMNFADGQFDAVFSMSVLEHLAEPARGVRELLRLTKRGGILSITTDVSLDGKRQLRLEQLAELTDLLSLHGIPLWPGRTLERSLVLCTDWYRRHEPGALPWEPRERSIRERASNLLHGRLSSALRFEKGFDSLAVAGLAFRKEKE